MTNTGTPRYAATYRQQEINRICHSARIGESLCLIGVAGTGKSNITNFLHSDPYSYKPQYLGRDAGSIHFPVIDGNTWNQTPEGLWTQMLDALADTTAHLNTPPPDPKIVQLYADQSIFSKLKAQVRSLCQQHGQRLMFILDDFDTVIHTGPLDMLEQFSALRNDGNRDLLSFLVFTKRLPSILERVHGKGESSKFYDLFSNNIFALGLYNADDVHQMLQYLNESAGRPLRSQEMVQIKTLCGGHARLLKLVFDLWRTTPPDSANTVAYFGEKPDIRNECRRILQGLHEQEQDVALRIAQGTNSPEDNAVIDHLIRRGLLENTGRWVWFSPLFEQYLRMA